MAEKKIKPEVKAKLAEMENFTKGEWANFNKKYAAAEHSAMLHKIDHDAYKLYMINKGLTQTDFIGGHYGIITVKAGAEYVDTASLYADLRSMGVDIDALIKKHTHCRESVKAFSFK